MPAVKKYVWRTPPGSMVYVGESMYPTFKAPEIIYFEPYGTREVRRGDVIIFDNPCVPISVTHRVIAAGPGGIRTRGDNNLSPDPWTLTREDLTGRVVFSRRDRRCRRVLNGMPGAAFASIWLAVRWTTFHCRHIPAAICRKAARLAGRWR
jgi:signal peptidase I